MNLHRFENKICTHIAKYKKIIRNIVYSFIVSKPSASVSEDIIGAI